MLLRLFVENFLSFRESISVNAFPYSTRFSKHSHHIYNVKNVDILKLLSIYGANASGKSNLIKCLKFIRELVSNEEIPDFGYPIQFALADECTNKPSKIAVEFISESVGFIYGVEVMNNVLLTEELYESGLGVGEDKLIFKRSTKGKKVKVEFNKDFYESDKNKLLSSVLEESILKPDKPILKFLTRLNNSYFNKLSKALLWFDDRLKIIEPKQSILGLAYSMNQDVNLYHFANEVMKSYHVGIKEVIVDKTPAEQFFGLDDASILPDLKSRLEESNEDYVSLRSRNGHEINIIEENNQLIALQVKLIHYNENRNVKSFEFNTDQESDGTKRLLDFIPAFYIAVNFQSVLCIDEIAQSIHPMLIKELLAKFSKDKQTKGQLIFTTHESNLLDQDIIRRDEIWFTEKRKGGDSVIYPLSRYKEHNTKNLRKGYLNGRYGAIPFLGNLKDLKWNIHDNAPEPHV